MHPDRCLMGSCGAPVEFMGKLNMWGPNKWVFDLVLWQMSDFGV